jgi:hypothetical protein
VDATHSILGLDERVIDSDDLDIAVLDGVAEDDTANSAEAIDANLDSHYGVWARLSDAQQLAGEYV